MGSRCRFTEEATTHFVVIQVSVIINPG